jgi:hypothetical protein
MMDLRALVSGPGALMNPMEPQMTLVHAQLMPC